MLQFSSTELSLQFTYSLMFYVVFLAHGSSSRTATDQWRDTYEPEHCIRCAISLGFLWNVEGERFIWTTIQQREIQQSYQGMCFG